MTTDKPLLAVRNLTKTFTLERSSFGKAAAVVQATNDVSFDVPTQTTLGIVGESGSGKSTLGRLALRIIEASGGEIEFDGRDLRSMPAGELRALRPDMTTIFQDPYSALDPRWTVGRLVGEPLSIGGGKSTAERRTIVAEVLDRVGLGADMMDRLPRAFSGGQRQRIVIARALVTRPRLVFCDEPVSALDVSTRAQVLALLQDLQTEFGLTYLFVSHDLGVVESVSDRIAVMYLGSIVEIGNAADVGQRYKHPYTAALISAAPAADPVAQRERQRIMLAGDPPSPVDVPSGCAFHPRCVLALPICAEVKPELVADAANHAVACHVTNNNGALSGPVLFDEMLRKSTTPPAHSAAPGELPIDHRSPS